MICPKCGATASLNSPDYGLGAEFKCYHHREYVDGYRFVSRSAEAKAESDARRVTEKKLIDEARARFLSKEANVDVLMRLAKR